MTLTAYDAAMAGVVVAGMIWGAWRGVTWQLASIASLILGYIASHQLSPQLASQFGSDPVVSRAILRKMKFEAFDRHLGMLLGGMEGAILGMVVTFFVVSLSPRTREPIYSSPTGKLVAGIIDAVGPTFKAETGDVLAPFVAESHHAAWTAEKVAPLLPAIEAEVKRASHADDGEFERR